MTLNKIITLLAHALVGWVLCAMTMGVGMAVTMLNNALIIHAIAAPIFFCQVSLIFTSTYLTGILITGSYKKETL